MIFCIKSIIDEELKGSYVFSPPPIEDIRDIISFMTEKLMRHDVAVVQGPPGTRKTLSMFSSIENALDKLDKSDLILYVAPTNALVAQGLQYAARVLFRKGYSKKDIFEYVRVYGSQFEYKDDYRKLRDKVSYDTKIVLTTPYQTPLIINKNVLHLMIDEASRMRFHEAFMGVRRKIIEKISKDEPLEGSMMVVGDPMQAIVLPEDYRKYIKFRRERLILESFIEGLLQISGIDTKKLGSAELMMEARKHLRRKWYEFINITYRLPHPTERPISMGYYAGELKAKFSFDEKLKQLKIDIGNSPKHLDDELLNTLSEIVFDCLSTGRPILIIEPPTSQKEWLDGTYGILNEPYRAQLAGALGVVLSLYGIRTTVLTAYRDQAFYAKMITEKKYQELLKRVGAARLEYVNVHRVLGGENDAVIAVLGKEYKTLKPEMQTVYFQEPELLNVQLSRHRVFLSIVGNLRKLIRTSIELEQHERTIEYKPIIETIKGLLELVGVEEKDIKRASRGKKKYESDHGIYIRWCF